MSKIREEFKKAHDAQIIQATERDRMVAWGASLWAAKWMAERCATSLASCGNTYTGAAMVRQLAKELDS